MHEGCSFDVLFVFWKIGILKVFQLACSSRLTNL